ncbi:MAG TPA: protease complex subunit PrcB family protein, partial [Trueperaceae bacterium]|nr:protease complex subunit PrcB family protein [Trueperaceae bacterium]
LVDAPASDEWRASPYAVDPSLLVDGKPYLSAPTEGLTAAPVTVSRIPQTTDLQLSVSAEVGEIVYYDGSGYLRLVADGAAGVQRRVVPKPRFNRLRGIGQLTNAEADALADALEQGGPFVIAALAQESLPVRSVDGLSEHLRTGVYVQAEIGTDESAFRPAPSQLTWEVLARGNQATGVSERRYELITNQAKLTSIWARAHATQLQPPTTPRADFQRETLVAIFMGEQPSGGYGVEVARVTEERGELYLDVRFTEPAAGAITSQALTSPWTIVRILRGGYQVAWIRNADDGSLAGAARATF